MAIILTIRSRQRAALAESNFEDWMAAHLWKFFPAVCDSLGERGVRELIRDGKKRAVQRGFRTRCDVCKYIDLMMVFGRDFDTNGRNPWATSILARSGDRSATMTALFAAACRKMQRS